MTDNLNRQLPDLEPSDDLPGTKPQYESPIRERDKLLVQKTFVQVEAIAEIAADLFYKRLFELDPDVRSLFRGDMKEQGRKLMSTLEVAVKGLDDLDELVCP